MNFCFEILFCFGLVRNLVFSTGKVNRRAGVDRYVLSVFFCHELCRLFPMEETKLTGIS